MFQVNVTESAENDLYSAANFIATVLCNLTEANDLLDNADDLIDSLEIMPLRHALVDDEDLADFGIRKTLLGNYLLFYVLREEKKVVNVLRVLYGRRDWQSILKTDLCMVADIGKDDYSV
jgi:plasmid stabilization system protein ParE